MTTIAECVCRDIDWYGFGRTRGGWVDRHGFPADPPGHRSVPAVSARGGIVAPVSRIYEMGFVGGVAVGWDPWIEWHPPLKSLADLMPVVSAPRGAIRYGTS